MPGIVGPPSGSAGATRPPDAAPAATTSVAATMPALSKGAGVTPESAGRVLDAAADIERQSARLNAEVDGFVAAPKAA